MLPREQVYEFNVDVTTYDLRQNGVPIGDRRFITVLAESDVDAFYRAFYLAAADGVEVIDVWWRY